jgi:hypothetical protein
MALTMALVEHYGRGDEAAIVRGRQALAALDTMDILQALFRFGQIIAPRLSSEHQAIVKAELAKTEGTPPFRLAVQQVGEALFFIGQKEALTTAVNAYLQPLLPSTDNAPRRVVFAAIAALGQICVKCDIKLNWSS